MKIHVATTPVDSPARVAYRFAIGQDLNGGYKTDHSWRKPGTQITSANGRASRWAHQSMRRRAGVRFLGLFGVCALLIGPLVSLTGTAQTLRVLAWLGLVAGGWIVCERARKYAQRTTELQPLAVAVAGFLKDSRYSRTPREWITLPPDVRDGTTVVYLPVDYAPTDTAERSLARLIGRRLGLGANPSWTYESQGERPYLSVRPAPAPRDLVDFADSDVRKLVESCAEGTRLLGLGPRDVPVSVNLDKYPHGGLSMATSAGKSTMTRGLLMQHLHEGGVALILDPKMDSQLWARELPNVRYCDTPQEIHEGLLWLSGEVDRRCAATKANADIRGDVDPALVGPRLMVIAEELNTLEIDLGIYWRTIRDARAGDPIKPPSLSALGRTLNMGRARRIHGLMIAQELLVQSLGGPAAKTNMAWFALGRAGTPTWNKLAPQCRVNGRYPRKMMEQGRIYFVVGDEPIPVQTMRVDEQTAIDYATSGTVSAFPSDTPETSDPERREGSPGVPHAFLDAEDEDEEDVEMGVELTTLADASERLALSLKTMRNARDRDPHFPDPETTQPGVASLYAWVDLEKWAINRASGRGGDAA